jgi:divalent metal cation (Fe/Co/Zn/Cd) transporter
MTSDADLRHSISMRPHPLHIHPHSSGVGSTTAVEVDPASQDHELRSHTHTPHVVPASDVEGQHSPTYTNENDPYQLSKGMKTDNELDMIRANTSRKRDGCGPLTTNKNAARARKVESFYRSQNENIERLLKPVDDHRREAKEERGETQLKYKIAVNGSFIANICLSILQVYGAASSGSLSLVTTMADSVFDPMSNIMLILCHRAVNHVDARNFPSGKARIENAGNIAFCFLMVAVSAIIVAMSARELAGGSESATKSFHLPSVLAVSVAFFTKLMLFFYCWAIRNTYSQVRILWEDHRNDLLINGFGILTSVGGSKLRWWIDPMGASILSVIIICLWLHTAWSEFQLLIGRSADTQTLQLITYVCKLILLARLH